MRSRSMLQTLLALASLLVPASAHAQSPPAVAPSRTLLAVFAHPDDETMVGPLLAHYARQPGTRVHLAIVTNGDKGVTPFANIPAGEPLAAVRRKEAACACEALGVQLPILLELPDAGLTSIQTLHEASTKLKKVIEDVRPDAIVTWGPEGGSGHPDHRLVSALVTQLVQAGEATPLLYYAGLPRSRLDADAVKELRFPAPFGSVADERLNARVPYSAEDAARAEKALTCHKSQFTPQAMVLMSSLTQRIHEGKMHLRSWAGGTPRTNLFDR